MKLKSYLRGIGAGLIVAALVMGVSQPKTLRALETVDNQTLKQTVSENKTENKEVVSTSDNDTEVAVNTDISEGDTSGSKKEVSLADVSLTDASLDDLSEDAEPSIKPEPDAEIPEMPVVAETEEITPPKINPLPEGETGYTESEEYVEIKVVKGDGSVSVARRMFEAGLIESAVEFDNFLVENGYDRRLCVGTYQMPYNATFEELANILMKKN